MSFSPLPSLPASTNEDGDSVQDNNVGRSLAASSHSSLSSSIEAMNSLDEEDTRMLHSPNADCSNFFIEQAPIIFHSSANTGITMVDSFVQTAAVNDADALDNVLREQLVEGGAGGIDGAEKVEQCQQKHTGHHQPVAGEQHGEGEQALAANNVAPPENNANNDDEDDESFAKQPTNYKSKLLAMALLALFVVFVVGINSNLHATANANLEESVTKLRKELERMKAERGELELKLMEADRICLENGKNDTLLHDLASTDWHNLLPDLASTVWHNMLPDLTEMEWHNLLPDLTGIEWHNLLPDLTGMEWHNLLPNLVAINWHFMFPLLIAFLFVGIFFQRLQRQLVELGLELNTLKNQQNEHEKCYRATKRSGQILLRVTNFNAFGKGCGPNNVLTSLCFAMATLMENVFSEPDVYINGLPWRIRINYNKDCIGISLHCDGDKNDSEWQCQAACQCSVISRTKRERRLGGNLNDFKLFSAKNTNWSWFSFSREDLMYGYDAAEDAVTIKAVVVTKLD